MKIKKEIFYKITAGLFLALPLISLAAMATVNFRSAIEGIFKLIGVAAGLIALACFVLGLYRFIISRGDPKTLDEAKVNIIWAVLAVLLAAALFNMTDILAYFGITLANP